MSRLGDQWSSLWPALAFLLTGVPLAALLGRLGFFDAAAEAIARRRGRDAGAGGGGGVGTSVAALWVLAALTTVVLNLDTTVVLLTPLYLRLARRADVDPVPVVAVPLLLASFASSVLPVSNLTNLIAADQREIGAAAFVAHLALPSLAASAAGWFVYRRRHPTRIAAGEVAGIDARALRFGGAIVGTLLVGFVVGPSFGAAPWMVAAAADVVLMLRLRIVPWREVPLTTAVGVGVVASVVALAAPSTLAATLSHPHGPATIAGIVGGGAVAANVVNNLPALLLGLGRSHGRAAPMTWGMWAWLLGVNIGAVFLPLGALANLLWLRLLRNEGLGFGVRRYASITLPIALPALAAAAVVLGAERWIAG